MGPKFWFYFLWCAFWLPIFLKLLDLGCHEVFPRCPRLLRIKFLRYEGIKGTENSMYLQRWILLGCFLFSVRIHKFLRDDHDEPHDHPWGFVSLILWTGYIEAYYGPGKKFGQAAQILKHGPMSIVVRRAEDVHKVTLFRRLDKKATIANGGSIDPSKRVYVMKPAWTLCITGPITRRWGFWCPDGWKFWKDFFASGGCA